MEPHNRSQFMTRELNFFRKNHLLRLLEGFARDTCPMDLFLAKYFKANPAVGSKDRKFISDTAYGIMRWLYLVDHCALPKYSSSWESRILSFLTLDPQKHLDDPSLPMHIRVSFPEFLYLLIEKSWGPTLAKKICWWSNFSAPVTVRVNPLKIQRDVLLRKWQHEYFITPTTISPLGIVFENRLNFFTFPEFKAGLFEVQDEGSQIIADLVGAKPKDLVLDYCAGSGGKTLGFAHKLEQTGQIYLHDIRNHSLREAKKRLTRAGIQNAQILTFEDKNKEKIRGKMDWVLVDAPCSGTGTLRRNPDAKWKLLPEDIQNLVTLQREIFTQALTFLKPRGSLVYATCSLLKEENEEQIAYFINQFSLELVKPAFKNTPVEGGMDGFFGAILRKKG